MIRQLNVLARNNVHVSGRGDRAMVFAHGFGCDQDMWRFVAPEFENDFKVVLFDHVGAGGSDLAAYDHLKYSTLSGYADDIIGIFEGSVRRKARSPVSQFGRSHLYETHIASLLRMQGFFNEFALDFVIEGVAAVP
jgi:hypothetical protein